MRTMNFDYAGFELSRMALELYKERLYRREDMILAEKLVNSAVDAGSSIAEVQTYAPSKRAPAARHALEDLDKLVFVVYLMKNEEIYAERRIAPVIALAQGIKRELVKYITGGDKKKAPLPEPPKKVEPVAPSSPVPAPLPEPDPDPDGFDDVVTAAL